MITVGATVSTGSGGMTLKTMAHTVDAGTKPLLVVATAAYNVAGGTYALDANFASFAGRRLELYPFAGNTAFFMWLLRDAPVGAGTLMVDYQAAAQGVIIAANLYGADVDQAETFAVASGNFGFTVSTLSVTNPSPLLSDSLILSAISKLNTETPTDLNGQTLIGNVNGSGISGRLMYQTGATGFTSGWSWATGAHAQASMLEIRNAPFHALTPSRIAVPSRVAVPTHFPVLA